MTTRALTERECAALRTERKVWRHLSAYYLVSPAVHRVSCHAGSPAAASLWRETLERHSLRDILEADVRHSAMQIGNTFMPLARTILQLLCRTAELGFLQLDVRPANLQHYSSAAVDISYRRLRRATFLALPHWHFDPDLKLERAVNPAAAMYLMVALLLHALGEPSGEDNAAHLAQEVKLLVEPVELCAADVKALAQYAPVAHWLKQQGLALSELVAELPFRPTCGKAPRLGVFKYRASRHSKFACDECGFLTSAFVEDLDPADYVRTEDSPEFFQVPYVQAPPVLTMWGRQRASGRPSGSRQKKRASQALLKALERAKPVPLEAPSPE